MVIVYIPPNKHDEMKEFTALTKIAGQEYDNLIVTGDLNAKSQDRDNVERNSSGIILEKFLNETNMLFLNDRKPTRRNSTSVIDLFLVRTSLVKKVNIVTLLIRGRVG